MKNMLLLTAAFAVFTVASAEAEPAKRVAKKQTVARQVGHQPGAPIRNGDECWVYTDGRGSGFWDGCDPLAPTPRGLSLRGRSEADIASIENASGGGGGGGGGGGR